MPNSRRDEAIANAIARQNQLDEINNHKNAMLRNTMQTNSNDSNRNVISKRVANPNSMENIAEAIAINAQNKTSEDAWGEWKKQRDQEKLMQAIAFGAIAYYLFK